jgi:hypothetical protein
MNTNNAKVENCLSGSLMERSGVAAKVAELEREFQQAKEMKNQSAMSSLAVRIKLWQSTLEWIDFHESKNGMNKQ